MDKKQATKLTLLCCLVYFASYITRLDYAAVLVEIVQDMQIAKTTAGIAVTGSFITYGAGMLIFGVLVHVMCCAVPFYFKKRYMISPDSAVSETMKFAAYFLLPATGLFVVFFFLTAGVQISAFAKGKTPYPKWCAVFSFLFGFVVIAVMKAIGDYPLTNALSTGWISLGSIFMLSGLLFCSRKAERI